MQAYHTFGTTSSMLTPQKFITKWSNSELSERAASQEHFIDLCRMLGQPTPAEHDATGAQYAFEKNVSVVSGASKGAKGSHGFADVWWAGKFGWEYKRKDKHKSLADAYRQLCQYREALENPPLLIVSDISRIEIHTNFTGTATKIHVIEIKDLASPENFDVLRRIFTNPESFKPTLTTEKITKDAASDFGYLAHALAARGHAPDVTAHFLMKCMFCLFAEDVELLPGKLFKRLLDNSRNAPEGLTDRLTGLFRIMAKGGAFGADTVPWFNGGLFDDSPAIPLNASEITVLIRAAQKDWSAVEPAIFGTLFERSLDPAKRSQIGAHYTGRDDIMLVVDPVILDPLRREWVDAQAKIEGQLERRRGASSKTAADKKGRDAIRKAITTTDKAISKILNDFIARLASISILDPACGSGNFLYVALQQLLNLEKEVVTYAARPEIGQGMIPRVRPIQLHGIEINPYASELAQVVIWIGYLQWMRENGFNAPCDPILETLSTIENRDAILDLTDLDSPTQAKWPKADFIIGNPPFLGSQVFRQNGLTDSYICAIHATYEDLPATLDLCCYWFELTRQAIQKNISTRAGLLATQSIRGGANRTVLQRIKDEGDIFMAWSDKDWILDGANVHVSIIGFDGGTEASHLLDGQVVPHINTDLTAGEDATIACPLPENSGIAFQGPVVVGPFDIDFPQTRAMLRQPNPSGLSSSAVLHPVVNAKAMTKRNPGRFIIDFADRSMSDAAGFEAPFEYIRQHVKPMRDKNSDAQRRERWWQHGRAGTDLRNALISKSRQLVTPRVSKFRIFMWQPIGTVVTDAVVVIARDDDYFLGVVHNSVHELWARRAGTQLREATSGCRFTPTTTFEPFPFPWPPGKEPSEGDALHPLWQRITDAAYELNELRERWLNPPEWIAPLAKSVDVTGAFEDVPEAIRPVIRQSAIMVLAAKDARLKKRTLTNLYNERPTWLKLAHQKLDRAVLAAYAATDIKCSADTKWREEWADVWFDTGAGQPLPTGHLLANRRAETEQLILENLLRLNQARAESRNGG